MNNWKRRIARNLVLRSLGGVQKEFLEIVCPSESFAFGDHSSALRGMLLVHDERFFERVLTGGDIGAGESFMDGDWSSPDLVSLMRLAVRNLAVLDEKNRAISGLRRLIESIRHRARSNTRRSSRRNIHAHYDLGNSFFRLFLDRSMTYSCAYFESPEDSLDKAQIQKFDRVCRKLALSPGDRLLEIGTGWGGFALHAATRYGCRVTTTTISREQYECAGDRFRREAPGSARIELLFEDYRNLTGRYDKIASIEMFEAVGHDRYDDYFRACDRLLEPDGTMLLQTITTPDRTFPRYRKGSDWIRRYIFPGSDLASVSEILGSLARCTRMSLFHAEDIGMHYARTLHAWRSRFHLALEDVRAQGFDERFVRMWDFYLAFCEGAFLERHIGDFQLLLVKDHNPRTLPGEEGLNPVAEPAVAGSSRPGQS